MDAISIVGFRPPLGVAAIVLFLVPVTLMMHNFWALTASGLIATTRVVGQALSVAIAGAVFIGLGGAAAGAALVARGASAQAADAALDGTFVTAMRAALLTSGLLAAAGAVVSLARPRQLSIEASRPQVVDS